MDNLFGDLLIRNSGRPAGNFASLSNQGSFDKLLSFTLDSWSDPRPLRAADIPRLGLSHSKRFIITMEKGSNFKRFCWQMLEEVKENNTQKICIFVTHFA